VGVFGRQGRRNVPTLINRGYGKVFFWEGRITKLEEQVLKPIQDPPEMDMTMPSGGGDRTSRLVGRRHITRAGELRAFEPLGQRAV
jgi:cytochrome c peroxidase